MSLRDIEVVMNVELATELRGLYCPISSGAAKTLRRAPKL
jgi:hypothetical protein